MAINTIIIDDEQNARENLKLILNEFCPDVNVIAEADSAEEARALIAKQNPDLLFLDDSLTAEDLATYDLIIVDEVGKLVSESPEFSEVLTEALDSGKPMILTIHKRSRNPLLQNIRKRDDLRTLEVTAINSAMLPSKVVSILKTGMV